MYIYCIFFLVLFSCVGVGMGKVEIWVYLVFVIVLCEINEVRSIGFGGVCKGRFLVINWNLVG